MIKFDSLTLKSPPRIVRRFVSIKLEKYLQRKIYGLKFLIKFINFYFECSILGFDRFI